ARTRAGARQLVRARGQAGDALRGASRRRAGPPGGRARGPLRDGRRGAPRGRLPLVRDGELLPARAREPPQPGLLARARLPGRRGRGGLDPRAGAAAQPSPSAALPRCLRGGAAGARRRRGADRAGAGPGAADAGAASRPAPAPERPRRARRRRRLRPPRRRRPRPSRRRDDDPHRPRPLPRQRRRRERAAMSSRPPLTPRQLLILTRVVDSYIATGHPVGSKALVEAGVVEASPSTVRYELAELEALGLLGHPHTSAGRVPTDAGYRLYAEGLLDQP